ncbi:MAG: 1-(5-phosphoribosyl)-5-[Clostridia bacterium]|nr:1-(5-phosphoribosyl)-5-[(5-phosphoribosylamino)methylideneamino]imidazole-4-carboxamide isomerase [Clostridia bacterium]MBR6512938.1 1-(5-phosphoribosyl)-5-[(5-phosphoribosylamino)methylideneamino]imidazole-4-carboxamide isomerase [Clostridia bacterium]
MIIMPAIDIYEGKVVRLLKGNYDDMTVYSDDPLSYVAKFKELGVTHLHIVDLEGAREGTTPNIEIIKQIAADDSIFTQVGGGIRNMETIDKYLAAGVDRIIIGTAAVTDEDFLKAAIDKYGADVIAVGVDIIEGNVAIKGWTEKTDYDTFTFCERMVHLGVKNIVCTDISKDGTLERIHLGLYEEMQMWFDLNIVASGGLTYMEDVEGLRDLNLYGAIIGKAYYTGKIDLKEAIEVAKK